MAIEIRSQECFESTEFQDQRDLILRYKEVATLYHAGECKNTHNDLGGVVISRNERRLVKAYFNLS